jgi:DNA-binding NarL/FixJ family response regulator
MNALLVDDHPLVLTALRSIVSRMGVPLNMDGACTAAEARSMLQLRAQGHANGAAAAPTEPYSLLLLDLRLEGSRRNQEIQPAGTEPPTTDGFVLLGELHERYPDMVIVVISGSDSPSDIVRAIDLGARGFLPKYLSECALGEALRLVLAGGVYVPPIVWPAVGDAGLLAQGAIVAAPTHAPMAMDAEVNTATLPSSFDALRLTPRQSDVLAALLHGKTNKLIAKELGLSIETVKDHVSAVLRVLGVRTRTQAVLVVGLIARRSGGSLEQWRSERPARPLQ